LLVTDVDAAIEWDEGIVPAGENGIKLRAAQFLINPQGDIERDYFLRWSVPPPGAAVLAAVAGIDHDGVETVAGIGRDRRAAAEKEDGRQGEKGAGEDDGGRGPWLAQAQASYSGAFAGLCQTVTRLGRAGYLGGSRINAIIT
jgi:hypothetical protein